MRPNPDRAPCHCTSAQNCQVRLMPPSGRHKGCAASHSVAPRLDGQPPWQACARSRLGTRKTGTTCRSNRDHQRLLLRSGRKRHGVCRGHAARTRPAAASLNMAFSLAVWVSYWRSARDVASRGAQSSFWRTRGDAIALCTSRVRLTFRYLWFGVAHNKQDDKR